MRSHEKHFRFKNTSVIFKYKHISNTFVVFLVEIFDFLFLVFESSIRYPNPNDDDSVENILSRLISSTEKAYLTLELLIL